MDNLQNFASPSAQIKITVRVVSFPNATERRAQFAKAMEPLNDIDWDFHDVVPAEGLPVHYDDLTAYRMGGSVMSPAERSCAASHLTMMREFLDGSSDYLVAMEDDVKVDPYLRLSAHAKFMKICGLEYYKLYARFFVPSRYLCSIDRLVFYRARWPTLGTQSYIVSRKGAQILLNHAGANGGLKRPIDDTNDAFWSTGLPIVFSYPFPLMELAFPSSIQSSRSLIHQKNAKLSLSERSPSRLSEFCQSIARRRSDEKLKKFDAQLVRRIEENQQDIYDAFFG